MSLLKSFNQRVWSPKIKATWAFMNVVIWRKNISNVYLCTYAEMLDTMNFFKYIFRFLDCFLKNRFFLALALEIKETQSFLNLNCEISYCMNMCKIFETHSVMQYLVLTNWKNILIHYFEFSCSGCF